MYGLSGATAVYPCLWCLCSKYEMQHPRFIRLFNLADKRTLENLKDHYEAFCKIGKKKSNAQQCFNVIDAAF